MTLMRRKWTHFRKSLVRINHKVIQISPCPWGVPLGPPGDYFWPLMAVPVLFIYTLPHSRRQAESTYAYVIFLY